MNVEWSDLNKKMQLQIKKKETFNLGIETLLELRKDLMKQALNFKELLTREDFNSMPFINATGYHNKTIAYSLYHIFRIEDILANSLILKQDQVFFKDNYFKRLKTPIITTGNELKKEEISLFSSKLDLDELYQYIDDVNILTNKLLIQLSYDDLKIKMSDADKKIIKSLGVVSNDEAAFWLIDYWCNKNIQGLIQMPFSRHLIMHIEACIRIKNKIYKD